jgi:hypothetical protein
MKIQESSQESSAKPIIEPFFALSSSTNAKPEDILAMLKKTSHVDTSLILDNPVIHPHYRAYLGKIARSPIITFTSSFFIAGLSNDNFDNFLKQLGISNGNEVILRNIKNSFLSANLFYSAIQNNLDPLSTNHISLPKLSFQEFVKKIKRDDKISQSPRTVYNCLIPSSYRPLTADNSINSCNHAFIEAGIHNVRSIAIHQEDTANNYIIFDTLYLQFIIKEERNNIVKARSENIKSETLAICFKNELSNFFYKFRNLVLCRTILKLNLLLPNLATNQMMQASFERKKRENPNFDKESELNQSTWVEKKNKKIVMQIQELEGEIDGWFEKFPSIFYDPNLHRLKELIKTQIENSPTLDEASKNFQELIEHIDGFHKSLTEANINITDNPIYNTIIEELKKEIFIEEFDPDKPSKPYFRRIDLLEKIDEKSKLENLFAVIFSKEKTILIPYICSIMLKKDPQKQVVIETYKFLHQDFRAKFMVAILESDRLDEMKDLILSEMFFRDLKYFLIAVPDLKKDSKTQIANFLVEQGEFSLLIELFKLNKINTTQMLKLVKIKDTEKTLLFFIKDIVENECIIFSHLVYANYIKDDYIKYFFSSQSVLNHLQGVLEKYLEKTISNSGDDSQKYIGFIFLNKLLENQIIDESLFSQIVSKCNSQNLELISKFLLTNDNRFFQNLLKDLLEKQLIKESDIFKIPDKIFLDLSTYLSKKQQLTLAPKINLKIFFSNLNQVVSSLKIEGCDSLTQYLIKFKKYKMLNTYLNQPDPIDSREIGDFDRLFNDALESDEGMDLAINLLQKYGDQITSENLSIDHAKKLACVFLKNNNLNLLKILLAKKIIANNQEIETGITLLDYAYSNLNMDIINFLRERNRNIPEQAQPFQPLIIKAEPAEPSELIRSSSAHQQNLDRIIAQYRIEKRRDRVFESPPVNFINITEAQIDELINALKFNPKKIDLSRLQYFLDHNARGNDIENFNKKLKDFFIILSQSDIGNIEEIDLGYNKIDIGFISGLIADNNCKRMFGRLKKLNLRENLFLFSDKSIISNFFDMIKDNIEELDLSSRRFGKTVFKIAEILTGLNNCKKLKKINLIDFKSENLSSLSKILEMPNLTEIIFSQPSFRNYADFDRDLEQISSKLKEHRNLEKLTIALPEFRHREIMANNLIFNYTLREITTDSPARGYDRINVNLRRNQIIFFKSKELYGEDHGSLLGKNLKDIQLKLLEITVDEKLIKEQWI